LVDWQYDQAIADGERSIALEPNSAHRYWYLANTLIFSGEPAGAIDLAKKAMRLDPRHEDLYLVEVGFAYSVMGRYEEAIPVIKRSLAAYPNNIGGRLVLILSTPKSAGMPMREPRRRRSCGSVLNFLSSPRRKVDPASKIKRYEIAISRPGIRRSYKWQPRIRNPPRLVALRSSEPAS
jgi:tetratricopeptide (TPR) repeat protein